MLSLTGVIQVADEFTTEFVALRMKRGHKFMILKVNNDKTQIVLEHLGARDRTFEEFKELLSHEGGRYGIFELEYDSADGRIELKIVLVLQAPDIVSAKKKFIYATSKRKVQKKVSLFNKEIQVNNWVDLNKETCIKYFKH